MTSTFCLTMGFVTKMAEVEYKGGSISVFSIQLGSI